MRKWYRKAAVTLCAVALCTSCSGQTAPAIILEVDTENAVNYVDDVADPLKKATTAAVTPLASGVTLTFKDNLSLSDIVAVNRKPVKGLLVIAWHPRLTSTTSLTPGRVLADVTGGCQIQVGVIITQPDGTPVGTIILNGTTALGPPPGAPTSATSLNLVVTGGTGAFLGVRGQAALASAVGVRSASMAEDPAYRRINGGGTQRLVIHLIQATFPEVITSAAGPAVFHGEDFTPVTPEKPARAGELLILSATNLGPTRPGVDPGKPFPAWDPGKVLAVTSPVEVSVDGRPAEVRNAVGWPEQTNVYRVDFRVPEGTKSGLVSVGLSAAWIAGPEVKIPVR